MANVWENIKNVFMHFGENWLVYIAEGIFLFLLIYYVLRTLKANNAKQLIGIYVALIIVMGVVCLISVKLDSTLLLVFIMLLSLFFLLLFSQEIKRSVWTGKRMGETKGEMTAKSAIAARAEEYIASIVRAVQNLSKNNTGALIVLSNGNLPKEIVARREYFQPADRGDLYQ